MFSARRSGSSSKNVMQQGKGICIGSFSLSRPLPDYTGGGFYVVRPAERTHLGETVSFKIIALESAQMERGKAFPEGASILRKRRGEWRQLNKINLD